MKNKRIQIPDHWPAAGVISSLCVVVAFTLEGIAVVVNVFGCTSFARVLAFIGLTAMIMAAGACWGGSMSRWDDEQLTWGKFKSESRAARLMRRKQKE